jgi:hypothetical protein
MSGALHLDIGGVVLRVESEPRVLEAMQLRYGAFTVDHAPDPVVLRVSAAAAFVPELERDGSASVSAGSDGVLRLDGGARGSFDLAARQGAIEEVSGLGPIDSLLRAALSLLLPADGALLVHAALARGRVFAGASGAGKSTAARTLGAECDELVILRPQGDRVLACATPYWQGRPARHHCQAVVCLRRAGGAPPAIADLDGVRAARALLANVVRYAVVPRVEREILQLAAAVCARTRVIDACCPEGGAYPPFVETLVAA